MAETRFRKVQPGHFCKFDDEQQIAYGWANKISKAGETTFDDEGHGIEACEMEPAVHNYVKASRIGTESHVAVSSELVASLLFSKEMQDALGIALTDDDGDAFEGWWVGYHVLKADTWAKVKSRELGMFSIAGFAKDMIAVAA